MHIISGIQAFRSYSIVTLRYFEYASGMHRGRDPSEGLYNNTHASLSAYCAGNGQFNEFDANNVLAIAQEPCVNTILKVIQLQYEIKLIINFC
jgi:hypothetical protein